MNKRLFDDIVNFLLPFMNSNQRENIVRSALYSAHVLDEIDWKIGASRLFTEELVRTLNRYGREKSGELVIVLLLRGQFGGVDRQEQAEQLIERIKVEEMVSSLSSSQAEPISDQQLQKEVREADLELLKKIWKYLNRASIESLVSGIQMKHLRETQYSEFMTFYSLFRNNPENTFNLERIEQHFTHLDKLFMQLLGQLSRSTKGVKIQNTVFYVPLFQLLQFDASYATKIDEEMYEDFKDRYDQLVEIAEEILEQHTALIFTIKKLIPGFFSRIEGLLEQSHQHKR